MANETVRAMFPAVELAKVGTWQGVRGSATITAADLESAVEAYADNEIDDAPVKFGHKSTFGAGEPAPGWVENLRLSDDKTTLLGDIVDVPGSLVPMIETGYRRRSVEMKHNVKTSAGKIYKSVLSGLALLGVERPAVKGLKAMAATYLSEVEAGGDEELTTVFFGEATQDTPHVPHTSNAGGDDSNNGSGDRPTTNKHKDEIEMAFRESLIAQLGLAADATDEQIEEAVKAAKSSQEAADKAKADKDAADKAEAEAKAKAEADGDDGEGDGDDEGKAPAAPETLTVSKAQWDEVNDQLAKLTANADKAEREELVETALSEGRIAASESDTYLTMLSEAPEAGRKLLASLPARYSTTARGHGQTGAPSDEAELKAMHAAADAMGL